jgi:hypothetical protein
MKLSLKFLVVLLLMAPLLYCIMEMDFEATSDWKKGVCCRECEVLC